MLPVMPRCFVVVVGGGNSAITAAIDLMGLANAVSVVNIVDKWQADPVLIKKIEGVGNIIPLLLHKVTEIKGQNAVSGVTIESLESNERKDIPVQGVFIEIGLLPNSEFAKDLVMFNRTGEIIVARYICRRRCDNSP